jgi:hypothetical protein
MRIFLRFLGIFDWTRDGSASVGRRMAVFAALLILGLALVGPVQAAPQLAERAQIAERIVAQMERKSAYFRILFEDHPHERANFIRELEEARRFGGRSSMLVASIEFGSRMGWNYFPYYYTRTSDAAVIGFARMTRDILSVLRAGSYEDCYDYMAGSSNDRARIFRKLTRIERRRMGVAMTQIVVQSRRNGRKGQKRSKPDPNAYRRPLNAVLARLAERLGRENLVQWKPGLKAKDQEKACAFAVAFFEETLRQPKRDSVLVLRAVFGE